MLVLRDGTLIGKIRISSVEPATAIGDIMSNSLARGVQSTTWRQCDLCWHKSLSSSNRRSRLAVRIRGRIDFMRDTEANRARQRLPTTMADPSSRGTSTEPWEKGGQFQGMTDSR